MVYAYIHSVRMQIHMNTYACTYVPHVYIHVGMYLHTMNNHTACQYVIRTVTDKIKNYTYSASFRDSLRTISTSSSLAISLVTFPTMASSSPLEALEWTAWRYGQVTPHHTSEERYSQHVLYAQLYHSPFKQQLQHDYTPMYVCMYVYAYITQAAVKL